jgi:hypothetical protein
MVALGVLTLLAGWAALMASMERNADLFGVVPSTIRAVLRMAAWMTFVASLALFVAARGIQQGPVYWTMSLMLGALATVLVGTWASRKTARQSR